MLWLGVLPAAARKGKPSGLETKGEAGACSRFGVVLWRSCGGATLVACRVAGRGSLAACMRACLLASAMLSACRVFLHSVGHNSVRSAGLGISCDQVCWQ